MTQINNNTITSAILGVAIGDALGVPVEFKSREYLKSNPVNDMIGYGTHYQPSGTWSDDTSLTLCLAEALCDGDKFDLKVLADYFVKWWQDGFWTAHGEVFDIGHSTKIALHKLLSGVPPLQAGGSDINDNGNGSLMRILPLLFMIYDKHIAFRFDVVKSVSSITHAHTRSVLACFYYLEFARLLLQGKDKKAAYFILQEEIPVFLNSINIPKTEFDIFKRLIYKDISTINEQEIQSSGYVVHTLEASIWCLLNTVNYKDAVLKAINLGEDTDTTAAVTGGLAGILYGRQEIPENWLKSLARKEDIIDLCNRMIKALNYK